ncbi:MAG: Na+/H+ antiporter subunit E [Planctomycetota bacterium]
MLLLVNVLLALVWAALIGPFSPANLLLGYVLGYFGLLITTGGGKPGTYVWRVRATIFFFAFLIYELVAANVRVAWYTVSNLGDLRPAVLAVPLERMNDIQITTLANLITLTPGTLTIDVAPDRRTLYVHFMHVDDPDEEIAAIKAGFERRILEVTT